VDDRCREPDLSRRATALPAGARTALASAPAASAWQTLWQEPRVNFAGQGTFDPATSTLKIERTSLAATTASLAAAGAVSKLTSSPEVDLSGEIAYDLGLVTREIQSHAQRPARPGSSGLPYGLDTLQLTGKQKRQFVLKGPLLSRPLASRPPDCLRAAARSRAGSISPKRWLAKQVLAGRGRSTSASSPGRLTSAPNWRAASSMLARSIFPWPKAA